MRILGILPAVMGAATNFIIYITDGHWWMNMLSGCFCAGVACGCIIFYRGWR